MVIMAVRAGTPRRRTILHNITFRGASLSHCVMTTDESGAFLRLNAKADYTDTIRDEMSWDELGDNSKSMELAGEIPGGNLVLTCQQAGIDGSFPELQIGFDAVRAFKAVRVKEKDQESSRVELRFQIITRDHASATVVFEYKATVKKALGELRLTQDAVPVETVQQPDGSVAEFPAPAALAKVPKKQRGVIKGSVQ